MFDRVTVQAGSPGGKRRETGVTGMRRRGLSWLLRALRRLPAGRSALLGGAGDVARHASRRRCRGTARPTTSRACPASPRGWKSARCAYTARPSSPVSTPQLEPGQPGQPHLGAQPQQLARARAPRPARSPARRRRSSRSRVAPAAAQPDPADQPVEPAAHRPGERERVPAVLAADRPRSPATAPSATASTRARRARRRRGCRRPSPGRSAAGRSARPGTTRSTSGSPRRRRGSWRSASSTARSKPSSPSGGSGT